MEPDIGSEFRFLPTPHAFDAPVKGFPSAYCHEVWYEKTRMVCPPDGENILTILLLFFDRIHERDRQTDKRTLHDGIGRAYA